MKSKLVCLLMVAAALPVLGSVTIQTQFGTAFNSDGLTPVADGTKWALVVDADNNSSFFGGVTTTTSLDTAGADLFNGLTLAVGSTLGTDRVFAIGTFNGAAPGLTDGPVSFDLGINGVAAGLKYAFYWFPAATGNASSIVVGSSVGGISSAVAEAGLGAMVIPADGANVPQGAATADGGGTISNARFTAAAMTAVPEPSAALLGAVGALGLLRRRRI